MTGWAMPPPLRHALPPPRALSLLPTLTLLPSPTQLPSPIICLVVLAGRVGRALTLAPPRRFPRPINLTRGNVFLTLPSNTTGRLTKKFRRQIGNMIFGCDICLAVCPFNKFAARAKTLKQDKRLQGPAGLDLGEILTMDPAHFNNKFSQSPIKRLGLHRLQRNALIVLANFFYDGGDKNTDAQKKFLPLILPMLAHEHYVVRGAAVWCLRAMDKAEFARAKENSLATENNPEVRAEWIDKVFLF